MNILIHEQDADRGLIRQAFDAAVQAGNGTIHVKVAAGGPVVRMRNPTLSGIADSPGGQIRWFVADATGNLVYLEDADWIEGYEGEQPSRP